MVEGAVLLGYELVDLENTHSKKLQFQIQTFVCTKFKSVRQ